LDIKEVCPKAQKQLERYHWPGNVRELEAVIESAINRISRNSKTLHSVALLEKSETKPLQRISLKDFIEQQEKEYILAVLQNTLWNMEETAAILSISPASLYRRISKYNIR
jgi:transcriptional regulator with PAS, ATPase and Fis domain